MFTDLFNSVLIEPAKAECNRLCIVSGYATAAMAFNHLNTLRTLGSEVDVELILGMCAQDGLSQTNHRGFQQLVDRDFPGVFKCSYIINSPPVHSKVYIWFKDNIPFTAYTGSANYTQTAFLSNQREFMAKCSPVECFEYFESLYDDTIYCNHLEAEDMVRVYNDQTYNRLLRQKIISEDDDPEDSILCGLPHVRVSLLDRSGKLPGRSGLNWGQRPEYNREPNQAYIRLPLDICRTDFFPAKEIHFTLQTDDNKVLICTRAQANGKGIQTPHNNSLIGQYFRNRLGLPSGALVKKEDLLSYGRTHVDFYKIDEETYFMDFDGQSHP